MQTLSVHAGHAACPARSRAALASFVLACCWAPVVGATAETGQLLPVAGFEGGTCGRQVDDTTFYVTVPDDGGDASLPATWRGWWYVRLDVPTDRPVEVEIDRIGWEHPYVPVFSYDQNTWEHLGEAAVVRHDSASMTLTAQFARSPVFLAQRHPYTEADLARLLADLSVAPARDMVRITRMGETPQGRPLMLVTVGDTAAATGQVWVHARVHPGEPQASWIADGMLRFLVSDDPAARRARASLLFHIVPLLNADGVALGHYRTNALGENLEPLWDIEAPPREIDVVRRAIAERSDNGPPWVAALNLHSSHAAADQPPFGFPHFGPEALGYTADEARLWTAQHALFGATLAAYAPRTLAASEGGAPPLPAPAGRSFLQVGMPERWWWRHFGPTVLAITVEAVDGQVGADGRWYTAEDAQFLGAALVEGLDRLQCSGQFPSR